MDNTHKKGREREERVTDLILLSFSFETAKRKVMLLILPCALIHQSHRLPGFPLYSPTLIKLVTRLPKP
jgi:hypothetical protein